MRFRFWLSTVLPVAVVAAAWLGYQQLTRADDPPPPASIEANGQAGSRGGTAASNPQRSARAAFGPSTASGPAITGTSVRAVAVSPEQQASELRLLAQVQASLVEDIQAPATGRITELLVSPGATLAQGQPLLRMSAPDLDWQLRQRQATVQETLARQNQARQQHQQNQQRLEQEQAQLARVQRLHGQGFASETDLQNARNQLANLSLQVAMFADEETQRQAQIEQARIQLEQAEYQVAQLQPEAPFDSLLAELLVSDQQRVQSGQTLLRLFDPNSLTVEVRIPVAQLPRLAHSNAQGELRLPEGHFPLTISQINPISEQGTVRVQLQLPADAPVVSGQTLDLWLQLPVPEPVWAVPESSLYQGNSLYLLEEGRIRAQPVEVLGQQWRQQKLWYLVAPPEGLHDALVLTTRLTNPISGQAVQLAGARP